MANLPTLGTIREIIAGVAIAPLQVERLLLKDEQIVALEKKVASLEKDLLLCREMSAQLEKENVALKLENIDLKAAMEIQRHEISAVREAQNVKGDPCKYCQKPYGKLDQINPDPVLGVVGVEIHSYECSNCGKRYDRQVNR